MIPIYFIVVAMCGIGMFIYGCIMSSRENKNFNGGKIDFDEVMFCFLVGVIFGLFWPILLVVGLVFGFPVWLWNRSRK